MKILIHSNSPMVKTGYGTQTAQLAMRLKAAGHDVAVSAFYGLQGTRIMWNDIPVYPQGMHPYGNDVILAHAEQHFGGDYRDGLILTLVDVWVLPAEVLRECNVACWTPVDHEPVPPRVMKSLAGSGCWPIAMSQHGQRELQAAGLTDVLYAPHGIDTKVLRPVDREIARDRIGVPRDAFVVGMVAANKGTPSRKGFSEAFQAFAKLRKKHPDAVLYVHSEVLGIVEGCNLIHLADACGIPEDAVVPMHQYHGFILGMPDEHMAYVYSALDVLMNPALGEGFGIPIVEAQACGTPVIVSDWTAMRELAGPGWKVEGQKWWTTQESWGLVCNVEKLTGALEKAYKTAGRLRKQARAFAEAYDADLVFDEYWQPVLSELERRMAPPEPARVPSVEVEEVAA